jgi:hypothetical protein
LWGLPDCHPYCNIGKLPDDVKKAVLNAARAFPQYDSKALLPPPLSYHSDVRFVLDKYIHILDLKKIVLGYIFPEHIISHITSPSFTPPIIPIASTRPFLEYKKLLTLTSMSEESINKHMEDIIKEMTEPTTPSKGSFFSRFRNWNWIRRK